MEWRRIDSILLCIIAIVVTSLLSIEIMLARHYEPVLDNMYHNPPPLVYCHVNTKCVPYIQQFGRK